MPSTTRSRTPHRHAQNAIRWESHPLGLGSFRGYPPWQTPPFIRVVRPAAVAPERFCPGTGTADQLGACMATSYAIPAIADPIGAAEPPRPSVLRTIAIARVFAAACSFAFPQTHD